MIKELQWDSTFFGHRIGQLFLSEKQYNLKSIKKEIKKAQEEGFQYLICKIFSFDITLFRALTEAGFYLIDIGINWQLNAESFKFPENPGSIFRAEVRDLPSLFKIGEGLFF